MTTHPQLVAFDLDGTLTESKSAMTPEMGALLGNLLAHTPVAIMSGGAWHQFEKQLLPALPQDANLASLFLFPVSAAQCYRFESGAWRAIYDHSFTPEERDRIMEALHGAIETTHFELPEPHWGERIEDRGAQITLSALGQQAPVDMKKVWDPDKQKRRPLYIELAARLPDMNVAMNAATSIDITHKGITKAYGIGELSRMTGISAPQMLYVGDALGPGGNDAVVIPTGVQTRPVEGPIDTAHVISSLIPHTNSQTI
ncbi:MAG TPA: HAD-IIB family hydrolase [Candidatus Paceibacterota bacterium]